MAKKMIYCPHCGEKINNKVKKCPHCGGRIKKSIFLRLLSFLGSMILVVIIMFVLFIAINIGGNILSDYFPKTRTATPTPRPVTREVNNSPTPIPTSTPEEVISNETDAGTGIRPGFKEFWDSYEAFYMEYCDYMESVGSSNDLTLMGDYLSLITRLEEIEEASEQWNDEDDMTSEEYAYFWGVYSRVMTRLAEVGE